MLIRALFTYNDRQITQALQKHIPSTVTSFRDVAYMPADPNARLDVFVPTSAFTREETMPTVVWIPGGAWVAGSKDDWAPYFMVLAEQGFAVVGVEYMRAPGQAYPTALNQLDAALAYVREHAARFRLDPDRIVLAGDSAGAQIATQYTLGLDDAAYAARSGFTPRLPREVLKGLVLYCGIYDFDRYFGAPGIIGYGTRVATWAYTGNPGTTVEANPALAEMSTIRHLGSGFPPAFVSAGNADPLTDLQSKPFAGALERAGVDVTTLFFPDDHEPGLGHEYQFDLDAEEGQRALRESVAFLREVLA
jgi:acetyl esterase/lipase